MSTEEKSHNSNTKDLTVEEVIRDCEDIEVHFRICQPVTEEEKDKIVKKIQSCLEKISACREFHQERYKLKVCWGHGKGYSAIDGIQTTGGSLASWSELRVNPVTPIIMTPSLRKSLRYVPFQFLLRHMDSLDDIDLKTTLNMRIKEGGEKLWKRLLTNNYTENYKQLLEAKDNKIITDKEHEALVTALINHTNKHSKKNVKNTKIVNSRKKNSFSSYQCKMD